MADRFEERWRAVFPDLHSASRILHASQLGRSRCGGAARDAAQQSRDDDQVREGIERANERAYQGEEKVLRFHYGRVKSEKGAAQTSVSG